LEAKINPVRKYVTLGLMLLATPRVVRSAPTPQSRNRYDYKRPHAFDFAKNILPDNRDFFRYVFSRESITPAAIIAGSTALLIWKDQALVDEAHRFGDRLHLSHDNDQTGRHGFKIGSQKIEFAHPENWGQALYFLGDGWLHFGVAGSFLGVGLAKDDNRALQTASQIVESVFASGLVVQVLKHTTGRESPFTTNTPGGVWRFFPNQREYHKNVAKHDAFPSGHLAAATASVTVINENYSEYRALKPITYTLLGLLSFQMMNNGVHWAGDYPLALGLGYKFGKIAVHRGRTPGTSPPTAWSVGPMAGGDAAGLNLTYRF
jgi:hypothetical protein